uniref:Hybrid signal transduction histidine kinase M n=1 Tax=Tanacetum cinerariifolium TaxID=118510 RepID=A0A6L2L7A3_TANCI|nr:hybrid signal transduction histidine kinase M [Tanacetum cinerariifolium]
MAVEDIPPPPPNSIDKIIPFSIPNKVPFKLDLEKHNYNSWISFSLIHLGSLGLESHIKTDTASTNPDWCQLDDLIKMWIFSSLCNSIQEQVVTPPEVINTINGLDSRFATLVEIIRHHKTLPTFDATRTMLLLKESSFNDDIEASTTFESRSSSPTILVASTPSDTKENNCSIKLDAFGFSVKDFLTRHIFLRCDSSGDLYPVTKPSTPPVAFVSTSASTWHQRLSNPGDKVLLSLTLRHFISCNKEKTTYVLHACQLGKHVKLPFHSSTSTVR